MRYFLIISSSILLVTSVIYLSMTHNEVEAQAVKPGGGVAVLELFTSEGCSSCPAADKLLGEMAEIYRGKEMPVYPLAFHVDYWNYLGWHDDYSSPAFTQRQREYGDAFRLSSIYTPQLVVNGKEEFVGSSRSKIVDAITRALSEGSTVKLTLEAIRKDRDIDILARLDPLPTGAVVVFAVAERELKREIRRGENAGLTLSHQNVVRVFETSTAASVVRRTLKLPQDLKPANSSIVAFVQDKGTLRILGATARDLIIP